MRCVPHRPVTLAEFLAWEERQELRFEFDGRRIRAMTEGTAAHSAIQSNVIVALGLRLRGKPCQVRGSGLKIEAAGSIRYPDAFVTCTAAADDFCVVRDPVVVFEVGGDDIDRIVKNLNIATHPRCTAP